MAAAVGIGGFTARPLVQLPATFVSVGCQLIPAVPFPAPVMDFIAALRWIADHIAEHGGSPDRLFGEPDRCVDATMHNRRMIDPSIAPDHVQSGPSTGCTR
jgi:hypothetical protein